jgi:hypothetical protein
VAHFTVRGALPPFFAALLGFVALFTVLAALLWLMRFLQLFRSICSVQSRA